MADPVFAPGDRVATNDLYAETFPRMKAQIGGTILPSTRRSRSSSNRYNVLWDGRATPDTVHASFLQREHADD